MNVYLGNQSNLANPILPRDNELEFSPGEGYQPLELLSADEHDVSNDSNAFSWRNSPGKTAVVLGGLAFVTAVGAQLGMSRLVRQMESFQAPTEDEVDYFEEVGQYCASISNLVDLADCIDPYLEATKEAINSEFNREKTKIGEISRISAFGNMAAFIAGAAVVVALNPLGHEVLN